jgi:cell division transport system permease protein
MSALGDRAYAVRRAIAMLGHRPGRFLLGLLLATAALTLPLLVIAIGYTAAPWLARAPAGPEVSLFITPSTQPAEVDSISARLLASPGVIAVRLIPRDQAYAELVRRSGIAAAPSERPNPLPDVLVARFAWSQEAAAIERVAAEARQWSGIDAVQADLGWYRRIGAMARASAAPAGALVALCGALVMLALIAAAAAQVEMRRDEVELLTQIGARPSFIVRPYAYAAALTLGLAAVLALALTTIILSLAEPAVTDLAKGAGETFRWRDPRPWAFAAFLVTALALGAAIGWMGAKQHLARHESS